MSVLPANEHSLTTSPSAASDISWRSWMGLCASFFFLAEIHGVTMPFVQVYLREHHWSYERIGIIITISSLCGFLSQLPGGLVIDSIRHHRLFLAAGVLIIGTCYGLLGELPANEIWVAVVLIIAAIPLPLLGPLTNALTIGIIGVDRINRAMGINQAWNHAGNIAAAASAMILLTFYPLKVVFLVVSISSLCTLLAVSCIRSSEISLTRLRGLEKCSCRGRVAFVALFSEYRVIVFLLAVALFHLANAPVMPLVALKIQRCSGSHRQVAAVVLVAQLVMIPVALLAGWAGQYYGRKWVFSIGFVVLPIRIALYTVTDDPQALVWLQMLDGVGAGIFGVISVTICADLTRGKGHLNTLAACLGLATAFGGVVGPVFSGTIVQRNGFDAAFMTFALIAVLAAMIFIGLMPETDHRLCARQTETRKPISAR